MDTSNLNIVISRYKEDINWISKINVPHTTIIYNKFYPEYNILENIGREGHTYLHHIVKNYEYLPNFILFTQADPIFHDNLFIEKVNSIDISLLDINKPIFFGISSTEGVNGNYFHKHPNGLPMYYFLDLLFNIKVKPDNKIDAYYGGIFLVSKQLILSRPKSFYKFLLSLLSNEIDPIEGYIIERLWAFIFDSSIDISNKYVTISGCN